MPTGPLRLRTGIAVLLAVLCTAVLAGFLLWEKESGPRVVRILPGPSVVVDEGQEFHAAFERAYEHKLANPDYEAFKNQPGIPTGLQDFPEEREIKAVRARIAASLRLPAGAEPAVVPRLRGTPPAIDGSFVEGEWDDAIRVPIGIEGANTTLMLMADARHLYLACDAPAEKTRDGFDQMRVYLHLNTTPLLVNERVQLGDGSEMLGGIRETRVRWSSSGKQAEEERWKRYDVSDWRIYRKARGASQVDGHRRYEIVLDLKETGLSLGRPFPARFEVESDPSVGDEGKSTERKLIGRLGAQTAPVWLVIE